MVAVGASLAGHQGDLRPYACVADVSLLSAGSRIGPNLDSSERACEVDLGASNAALGESVRSSSAEGPCGMGGRRKHRRISMSLPAGRIGPPARSVWALQGRAGEKGFTGPAG